jgi:hypothetical protein
MLELGFQCLNCKIIRYVVNYVLVVLCDCHLMHGHKLHKIMSRMLHTDNCPCPTGTQFRHFAVRSVKFPYINLAVKEIGAPHSSTKKPSAIKAKHISQFSV